MAKQDYKFIDKCVWIEKEKILVIADLHIGYEQGLQEKGAFIPRQQYKITVDELRKVVEKTGRISKIIILGDLKHDFSRNSNQEWGEISSFLYFLYKNCEKIILIKGNHDNFIENITSKKGVDVKDYLIIGENAFIHGDKQYLDILDKKIKRIFIGHLHPAVSIRENAKVERYKCFLVGKWKGKEIVILPSFFPLIEGVDISREDMGEGNLVYSFDLNDFKVFIGDGENVLDFGKLKEIEKD